MPLNVYEEITREAQGRLLRNPYYSSSRHIACHVDGGVLTLCGTVPTYYLKQVAQSLVAGIDGVERIENQIEVTGPAARRQPAGALR